MSQIKKNPFYPIYLLIILIAMVGISLSYGFAINDGFWDDANLAKINHLIEDSNCCKKQHQYRKYKIHTLKHELKIATFRLNKFKESLTDQSNQLFIDARDHIDKEKEIIKAYENKLSNYPYQPLNKVATWDILGIILIISFSYFIVLKMYSEAEQALHKFNKFSCQFINQNRKKKKDKPSQELMKENLFKLAFVAFILFGIYIIRYLMTSVFIIEKEWFNWISYCVYPKGAILSSIYIFALILAMSCPIFLGITVTRKAFIPPVEFTKNGLSLKIKRYIVFLEKWVVISSLAFLLPTFIRLYQVKLAGAHSISYTIDLVVGAFILLLVIGRVIRNVLLVRRDFYIKSDIEAKKFKDREMPLDPTITILGEYWWKLIAALIAVLGLLINIFENLGLTNWINGI